MAKKLTKAKAKKILREGRAKGKALTGKQKKFFGAIAGGQKSRKGFSHKGKTIYAEKS